ncbi:MAG: signal peptidase I [Roseburia sp.]|nr:signal peptidase I [Roseburia sp.]MCM1097478.1 signal peptidase I [Ruminococcus flavefaciens]
MKRGKIVPAICNILGTLILLSVIAAFLPITIPRLMGYQIYNIVSGSMEPAIPTGSLVFVEPAQPTEVQAGEIIAYYSGSSAVTHRVVQNRLVEGEFVTKGDANEQEDINTVPYASLVGRVVYHLPYIGQLLVIYTSGVGKLYIICYAACGVLFNLLAGRLRDRGKE